MIEKPYTKHNSADDLGRAWKMPEWQVRQAKRRAKLGMAVSRAIRESNLTHEEIATRASTGSKQRASRTRITALANGATDGFSDEYLIRILEVLNYRVEVRVSKRTDTGRDSYLPI